MIEWLFSQNGFGVLLAGAVVPVLLAVIVLLVAVFELRSDSEYRKRRGC